MRSKFKWIYTLVLAFAMQFSFAQEKTITGTVTEGGMPLPGVGVIIKGTSTGTETDFNGKYTIKAKQGQELEFSYIGMKKQTIKVAASNSINVAMVEDKEDTTLADVIVVGYGKKILKNAYTGNNTTIKSAEINKTTFADPTQALQGKVPGLQISTSSGSPGAQQRILIRGINSLTASNQPLYVVDGVPITDGNFAGANSTTSLSHMAFLSNDNVESMSVITDAVGIAPYGAAGANGVIIITTKKGNQGDAKFSFSTSLGIQNNATDGLTPLNGQEKQQFIERAIFNSLSAQYPTFGLTPTSSNTKAFILASGISPQYSDWVNNPKASTNWYDDHLKVNDALIRIADLSVRGGNDTTNYYASLGANKTDATIIGNDFTRVSGTVKMNTKLNSKLSMNIGLTGSNVKNNGSLENGAFFSNGNLSKYFMSPWIPVYNANGSLNLAMTGTTIHNTVFSAKENIRSNDITRALFNLSFDYEIIKNLKYKPLISGDYSVSVYKDWRSPLHGDGLALNGFVSETISRNFNYTFQNQLDYTFKILDNHNFNVSAISEFTKLKDHFLFGSGQSFNKPNLQNISNATANFDAESGFSDRISIRYVGTLGYNYNSKYLIDFSYAYQGDSRFTKSERFGDFYSIGAAWNLHEEEFIKKYSFINSLRLRGSYGTTGNANINRNLYYGTFGVGGYNNFAAVFINDYGNEAKWDSGIRQEVGVEFAFLKNRINGKVSYFNNKTVDGLFSSFLALEGGTQDATNRSIGNVIDMTNKGTEFSLDFKVINKDNFKWSLGGNYATINNEITKLSKDPKETFINIGATRRHEVGYQAFTWHMPLWAGVNPANGDPLWYTDDTRTTTTNVYAQATRQHTGTSRLPKYSGGVNTKFDIYNFFIEGLIAFQGGNQVYEDWAAYTQASWGSRVNTFNATTEVLNGAWTTPGQDATHPRLAWNETIINNAASTSTRWLRDGDFVRLRELAIGYNFKQSMLKNTGISNLGFSVRASNLFTWVKDDRLKYDPEVLLDDSSGLTAGFTNLSNPPIKQVVFQVNLNF